MSDRLTPEQRSERMSRVRQQGTSLELLVRKELHRRGLRYRLGGCGLPGRPDLVFPGRMATVFVHGCFWHSHDCSRGRRPTSNSDFWLLKSLANNERDARKEAELRQMGWHVFVVWQCHLADRQAQPKLLDDLARSIRGTAERSLF